MAIQWIANTLLYIGIFVLAVNIMFCLYRAVKGPRVTDTLLAVNVINVKTIVIICVLAVLIEENYLVDIGIVYSIIGFIAVATFARLIIRNAEERFKLNQDSRERVD